MGREREKERETERERERERQRRRDRDHGKKRNVLVIWTTLYEFEDGKKKVLSPL